MLSKASASSPAEIPDQTLSNVRMQAFAQTFAWTNGLLAALLPAAADPLRAATAFSRRLVQGGWLCSSVFDLHPPCAMKQPLCSSTTDGEVPADRLAYALERRFSGASEPTRVFWPSPKFARRYGSWMGAESYSCPHKLSHDVLITAVWLHYLQRAPDVALNHWVSERWLQFARRRGEWQGPIPDALISDGERITAIEIGGNYPAAWIRHHVQRFEAAGWAWQLW